MGDSSRPEATRPPTERKRADTEQRAATDRVFEVAYTGLRRLASGLMYGERSDHTLRPTGLVHEAYLRLANSAEISWQGHEHFFRIAARAMRRVLVDHARARAAAKREGSWVRIALDPELPLSAGPDVNLLRFEESLTRLSEVDGRMGRIVELRVFGGMKIGEIARALGVSSRTVDNEWSVAKMWLTRAIAESRP
jgi:RNA polymerase sigma factor (TIGR02999 family)